MRGVKAWRSAERVHESILPTRQMGPLLKGHTQNVYVYCISHVWLSLLGQWTVLYWGDWVPIYTSFWRDWAGVFNVPEGDSPQNMAPPFIAWCKLFVSQTRLLASIMLHPKWRTPAVAKELGKSSYTMPVRRSHKIIVSLIAISLLQAQTLVDSQGVLLKLWQNGLLGWDHIWLRFNH